MSTVHEVRISSGRLFYESWNKFILKNVKIRRWFYY